MAVISFARDTITIKRPAVVIERGDKVFDWIHATTHTVSQCIVQPLVGEEVLGDRDAVISRWKLFAPYHSDILSTDHVIHDGVEYEVDGSVQPWPSPTGTLVHDEIMLRKIEG